MNGFFEYMVSSGISTNTAKRHVYSIQKIQSKHLLIDEKNTRTFLAEQLQNGVSKCTVNKYIQAVHWWCKFTEVTWSRSLKKLKEEAPAIETLTNEEIESIVSAVDNHYSLFWQICAYTGMRMGEVAKIKLLDIDAAGSVIYVRKAKNASGRTIPIPNSIKETILHILNTSNSMFLFHIKGHEERPITHAAYMKDWKRRLSEAGIRKRVTPYVLRHSFITRMLVDAEANLFPVQDIVGHKDSNSTRRYYHNNLKAMRKTITKDPLTINSLDAIEKLSYIKASILSMKLENDKDLEYSFHEARDSFEIRIAVRA